MLENQLCYRLNGGVPMFTLPHRVSLSDGTTRTDATQWFPECGAALGWTESNVTEQEAAAYEAEQIEHLRAAKLVQNDSWFTSLQSAFPTTLGFSIHADNARLSNLRIDGMIAYQRVASGSPASTTVWDNFSTPHVISDVVFLEASAVFEISYKEKLQEWVSRDTLIKAATSRIELEAIEIP